MSRAAYIAAADERTQKYFGEGGGKLDTTLTYPKLALEVRACRGRPLTWMDFSNTAVFVDDWIRISEFFCRHRIRVRVRRAPLAEKVRGPHLM